MTDATLVEAMTLLSPSDLMLVAVSTGDMNMLKCAMSAVEAGCPSLPNAVYLAAEFCQNECLQSLLSRGVPPTDAAMWAACRRGDRVAIQQLVEHGLIFTERAKDICIRHGHMSIITALE